MATGERGCDPVPDTAMGTGSDAGEPGERPDERPLRPDEWAVLAEPAGAAEVTEAAEDSPAAARAVRDDSVLPSLDPGSRGDGPDPATPQFRAPGDG